MGFLSPLDLLFGLSLMGLVLIYLRARTRSTVEVSSLMLFEEVQAPTSSFRFLRLDAYFWIEAFALSVLTLAVAGLYLKLPPAASQGHRHALVFDLAAAMEASQGSHTRLALAKSQALGIVSRAGPGDQFSVVGYATQPVIGCRFTSDVTTVRRAINGLTARDVASTPAALTAALMRVREADHIDLFAPELPPGGQSIIRVAGARLAWHQIGTSLDNAAIAGLEPGIPTKTQGRATVRNLSPHPMLITLGIFADGGLVFQTTALMQPHSTAAFAFGPLKKAGIIEARLLSDDPLAADNSRYANAVPEQALKVLVLSPDGGVRDDLARILRAAAPASQVMTADPTKLTPGSLSQLTQNGPPDLLIVHDADDPAIAAGARLLIFPHDGPNMKVLGTLRASQMDSRAELGALTRPLKLGPTRELSLPDWMDPIARGTGLRSNDTLTLAAYGSEPAGRLGVIAFDIRNHRLLDPDMLDTLVLAVNLVRSLTAPRDVRVVPTGTYVTIPAATAATVREPGGRTVTLDPGYGQRIRLLPLYHGPYEITIGKRKELLLANYFNARESDLAVGVAATRNGSSAPQSVFAPISPVRPIRPVSAILLVLALAAILLESVLLAERAIRGGAAIV